MGTCLPIFFESLNSKGEQCSFTCFGKVSKDQLICRLIADMMPRWNACFNQRLERYRNLLYTNGPFVAS